MASNFDLAEDLQKHILTCCICEETYKSPCLLPCTHIFCRVCLARWIKQAADKGLMEFECPLCRRKHNLPKSTIDEEWPQPHFLSSLQDMVDRSRHQEAASNESPGPVMQPGSSRLCRTQDDINTTGHHSAHISNIGRTAKRDSGPGADDQSVCSKHLERLVEFFCKDCSTMCCARCAAKDHQFHSYLDINDVATEYTVILKANLDEINENEKKLKNILRNIKINSKTVKEKVVQSISEINNRSSELIDEIKKHEESLIQQVKDEELKVEKQLEAQKELAKSHLSSLSDYRTRLVFDNHESIINTFNDCNKLIEEEIEEVNLVNFEESVLNVQCNFSISARRVSTIFGNVELWNERPTSSSASASTSLTSRIMDGFVEPLSNEKHSRPHIEPSHKVNRRRRGRIHRFLNKE